MTQMSRISGLEELSPLASAAALTVSLLPVLSFALALVLLDGYRLIRLRTVGWLLLQGALAAFAALVIHRLLLRYVELEPAQLARYVAPPLEELLKGLAIVHLVRRHRVGFLVDASISGFAVGAGFAAVENVQYFLALGDPHFAIWLVRGFGTAVMHGGATALFALCSKSPCRDCTTKTSLPRTLSRGLALCWPHSNSRSSCCARRRPSFPATRSPKGRPERKANSARSRRLTGGPRWRPPSALRRAARREARGACGRPARARAAPARPPP